MAGYQYGQARQTPQALQARIQQARESLREIYAEIDAARETQLVLERENTALDKAIARKRWTLQQMRAARSMRLHEAETVATALKANTSPEEARRRLEQAAQEASRNHTGTPKLRPEQVVEIIRRAEAGEPHTEIAADYGVTRNTIGNIARGLSWQHIPRSA